MYYGDTTTLRTSATSPDEEPTISTSSTARQAHIGPRKSGVMRPPPTGDMSRQLLQGLRQPDRKRPKKSCSSRNAVIGCLFNDKRARDMPFASPKRRPPRIAGQIARCKVFDEPSRTWARARLTVSIHRSNFFRVPLNELDSSTPWRFQFRVA